MVRRSSCGPIACWILARTSSLVPRWCVVACTQLVALTGFKVGGGGNKRDGREETLSALKLCLSCAVHHDSSTVWAFGFMMPVHQYLELASSFNSRLYLGVQPCCLIVWLCCFVVYHDCSPLGLLALRCEFISIWGFLPCSTPVFVSVFNILPWCLIVLVCT